MNLQLNDYQGMSYRDSIASLIGKAAKDWDVPEQNVAKVVLSGIIGQAQANGEELGQEAMQAILELPIYSTLQGNMEQIKKMDRRIMQVTPKKPVSLLATTRSVEEIMEDIHVMTTFLACNELLFASEMQLCSYRILNMLKEKNLYRHQLKKHANKLKEVTDRMSMLANDTDKSITLKQCGLISPHSLYAQEFFDDGGGLMTRMQMTFHKEFEIKFKRIRLDNRWIADLLTLKHPDLVSEIFTLISLAQCDIELFEAVQKKLDSITRGRLKSKSCIKSTHSESIRNAARGLSDQFVNRMEEMPTDAAKMIRQHLYEFNQDITGERQFEFFNGQFLALKMDYIEYYLARLRMDMEGGNIGVSQIRDVWFRLGKKHAVKQFFAELGRIRIPKNNDLDAMDFSKVVATSKGEQKAMNSFRRLGAEGQRILPDKEPQEVWECRVLRTVARRFNGQLPDDVLRSMMRVHLTKKAVMNRLTEAGFELIPTLRRVRRMKVSELKQL